MNREVKEAIKLNLQESKEEGVRPLNYPDLEIGQVCNIMDVWDGNGDWPDSDEDDAAYSYYVKSYTWITYWFKVLERNSDGMAEIVKITEIATE